MKSKEEIAEEMQKVVEQMRLDDIEDNPDSEFETFECDCCGREQALAGSIEYSGYRLCNDCVLIAETGFALGKIKNIEELIPLAPLHNKAHLIGIESFKEVLKDVKQVVVFDTAFHQTMKESEYLYPLPMEWAEKYGVRKYGFHGTSHRFISEFMNGYLKKDAKIISCHIGNGASICAIENGKCKDTSMGFTPLAGLMMGTRCGDIDVSVVPYLCDKLGISASLLVDKFNKESGLLAITGVSSDLRDVESEYMDGNVRCILGLDMYSKKIVNYISMYNTLLDGAEHIVFTAGVGENSPIVRGLVCDKLKAIGVEIDKDLNEEMFGKFGEISTSNSKIKVFVVPTDEEVMIARDTFDLVKE